MHGTGFMRWARRQRGFTLVEVMVAAAIIGLLASMAIPQFTRASVRARTTERATVLSGLWRAIGETASTQQRLPANPWSGPSNPPGAPGTGKRAIDWSLGGWHDLPMMIEGSCYYSYQFLAEDPGGTGRDVTLTISATGDLDGDGVPSVKAMVFRGRGFGFERVSETPAPGLEDAVSY